MPHPGWRCTEGVQDGDLDRAAVREHDGPSARREQPSEGVDDTLPEGLERLAAVRMTRGRVAVPGLDPLLVALPQVVGVAARPPAEVQLRQRRIHLGVGEPRDPRRLTAATGRAGHRTRRDELTGERARSETARLVELLVHGEAERAGRGRRRVPDEQQGGGVVVHCHLGGTGGADRSPAPAPARPPTRCSRLAA